MPDYLAVQIECARYPRPNDAGRDRVFVSDLIAEIETIPGVIATAVVSPSGTLCPTTGALLMPGVVTLRIGS